MPFDDNSTLPVLIVGAGPTGLTLAASLARYGVPVRLIEKRANLSRHTKATNLMQRSQEVLYALGLLAPMQQVGGQMNRLVVHAYGKPFGASTMHLKETPFHDVILCGQDYFEAAMAEGLAGRGVQVEFGTALTNLVQDAEGVTATLEKDGVEQRLRCAYVVGCDGGNGITRTFTRNDFTPQKTDVGIRQVDCKLQWRRSATMEQMWLFYFQNGFAAIVPLPGGVHRLLTIEPKRKMPERSPTLEEMQARIREIVADDSVLLSEPSWFSYTDLAMGIAPGLRDGRVLLAGDVGNPILPNGGQGMNTGIGDAFNLAWKMAAVLQGGAPDALLDTYNEERHTLREALQKTQYQSLKYTTHVTPKWMQTVMKLVGEPALKLGGEYRMAQAFSQLKIDTRRSALTLDTCGRGGLRAGDRALNEIVALDGLTTELYELIYASGWTLLAFTGSGGSFDAQSAACVRALQRSGMAGYVVSTRSLTTMDDVPVLYDLDELAHRRYGVRSATLYLVRPDGHVGARVRTKDLPRLEAYVQRWMPQGGRGPVQRRTSDALLAPSSMSAWHRVSVAR